MVLEVIFYTGGTLYGVLALLLLLWGEEAERVEPEGEPLPAISEGGSIAVEQEPVSQLAA